MSEVEFLKAYDPTLFERPSASVDMVIFTLLNRQLHVLTVKRDEHPFKDCWSLVGGYVDLEGDTTLEATARRKLQEKTGVKTPYLEQFLTIGNATRDPRGWSITTVYFALIAATDVPLKPGKGAVDSQWSPIENSQINCSLAFDHAAILTACIERLRHKVLYTSLPVYLMSEAFTLSELQDVYEIILGKTIDPKSFRRRLLNAEILAETGEMRSSSKRPAKLYRLLPSASAHFFLRTIEAAG